MEWQLLPNSQENIMANIQYLALVFSQIAYCWPVICDIPQHCFTKLCSMERRASNLSERSYNAKELSMRLHNICLKLMKNVRADKNHPIRDCFIERPVLQNVLRNFIAFVPMNKSSKLIKFSPSSTIGLNFISNCFLCICFILSQQF